jgi:hypothetical protein
VGAGAASAGNGRGKPSFKAHAAKVAGAAHVGGGSIFDAATAYLQIDMKTLLTKLRSGESLAQVAVDQGKTSDGLTEAIVAATKAKLDARVAAGKLDSVKEATLLAQVRAEVGTFVKKTFGGRTSTSPVPPFTTSYLKPMLDYLEIDATTLVQALSSGTSLADIAVAHGKTAAGLEDALLGPIRARLDAAVTSGTLTSAQRDALATRLQTAVQRLVGKSSF